MEYNIETFQEKENKISYKNYPYYSSSITYGFYTFYKNEKGFFLPLEDKESLKERLYFYQKYISKEKYPVYTNKFSLKKDSHIERVKLSQVLSIPESILSKRDDNYFYTYPDELLNYIHFDSRLKRTFKLDTPNQYILSSNDPSVILAINYLIKNGFYVLNPERIFDYSLNDNGYFPIYIHEERVPEFLKEQINGHKLLMDFVSNPLDITKDIFTEYFKNIEDLSLTEMVKIAFKDPIKDKGHGYLKIALRKYIYALIRKLLNIFYEENTNLRGILSFTVLDHDFKLDSLQYHKIYQGNRYYMVVFNERSFNETDESITQSFNEDDYYLDSSYKPTLTHAFNFVQSFFKKHKQYNYLPSLFLKLMGLPYPAFEMVKYFDFENGTSLAFLNQLKFKDNINLSKYGLALTFLDDDGNQISLRSSPKCFNAYFDKLSDDGLYISTNFPFFIENWNNFIFHINGELDEIKPVISGDTNYYKRVFEALDGIDLDLSKQANNMVKQFIIDDNDNGKLKTIEKFYTYLQDGYSSFEALSLLNKSDKEIAIIDNIISIGFTDVFIKMAKKYLKKLSNSQPLTILNNIEDEVFTDQYLKYPIVYKGRNFIAYSDGKDIYFDERDKNAILTLLNIIIYYSRKENNNFSFKFPIFAFSREIKFEVKNFKQSIKNILLLLGLPKVVFKKIKSLEDIQKLNFEKDISIFSKENHINLIKDDESLNRLFIFSEALKKGIYLYSFNGYVDDIIIDKDKVKNSSLMTFMDPEQVFLYINKQDYPTWINDFMDELIDTYLFNRYPSDECLDEMMYIQDIKDSLNYYASNFNKAFVKSLYSEFLSLPNESYSFGVFKKDGLYVAVGRNFYAISNTGNKNDFHLLNVDKERFDEIISTVLKYYQRDYKKGDTDMKVIYALGLPNILIETAYETLIKTGSLSSSDFSFISMDLDTHLFPSCVDTFEYEKNDTYSYVFNTPFDFESIQNGLFFFNSYGFVNENFNKKNIDEMMNYLISLKLSPLFISDKKGKLVEEIFIPGKLSFINILNKYSDAFIKEYGYSKEIVLKLKEFLIYNYEQNDEYLISLTNDFYLNSFKNYYKKLCDDLSQFELTNDINKRDSKKAVYFISLFIYTMRGRYICALNTILQKLP